RPPAARAAGSRDDVWPAGRSLLDLHLEPGPFRPAGDVARELGLAGSTRDQIRVDGVDLDEPLEQLDEVAHRLRMRAASAAAFFALSTPTHATGTPGGIWTIERSASSPSRTLPDDRSGTPITGRSVCAAATPGSAAASPAPAMITFRPRSRA